MLRDTLQAIIRGVRAGWVLRDHLSSCPSLKKQGSEGPAGTKPHCSSRAHFSQEGQT